MIHYLNVYKFTPCEETWLDLIKIYLNQPNIYYMPKFLLPLNFSLTLLGGVFKRTISSCYDELFIWLSPIFE